MFERETISSGRLVWRKTQGCFREFGPRETIRRIVKEILQPVRAPINGLDISAVTERVAIGAAPKTVNAVQRLISFGLSQVIDLRAERKNTDILVTTNGIRVSWVPTYDDWQAKSFEFFEELQNALISVLKNDHRKLLICCGAGEHRAPLAGVLALVMMGYPLNTAMVMIQRARSVAELLPVYISSLKQFLESTNQDSRNGFIGSIG